MTAVDPGHELATETALRLAEAGYYVAPVTIRRNPANGKKAPKYHGYTGVDGRWLGWDALSTRDPDTIRTWAAKLGPDLSWCIDCAKSGIVVIDLDIKGDLDTAIWWAGQGLPVGAFVVETPSGGLHSYWRARPDHPIYNSEGRITPGVDVRGDGGHVYAPGSGVVGGEDRYTPRGNIVPVRELATLPDDILAVIEATGATGTARQTRDWVAGAAHDRDWVARTCAEQLAKVSAHMPVPGAGFRHVLMGAAMVIGRAVAADIVTRHYAETRLIEAVEQVWGRADPDDFRWIQDGLDDGQADPWTVTEPGETVASVDPPAEATQGEGTDPLDAAELYRRELEGKVREARLRRDAKRLLDAEELGESEPPSSEALVDLLAEPDAEIAWRINELWPVGGKIMFSAPKKAGKTTTTGNLIRSLADAAPFLGRPEGKTGMGGFPVAPLAEGRSIVLFDFEMTREQLKRWLRLHNIQNPGRVHVKFMRGKTWDIRDRRVRHEWAEYLRSIDAAVVIVDPLASATAPLGIPENDNMEMGRFLHALDALVLEAGADEHLVNHHTAKGRDDERGAGVIGGWPDAIWRLVLEDTNGYRPDPSAPRFFAAEGRDVAVRETVLQFDEDTKRLWLGIGNRATHAVDAHSPAIVEWIEANPGATRNAVREAGHGLGINSDKTIDKVLGALRESGAVHTHDGPNRSKNHYPGPRCKSCGGSS